MDRITKKRSAFTLIEMMVVMAIIAILATAGLSAYTGYQKSARDAIRIADVIAMDAIVLEYRRNVGSPPASELEFNTTVTTANNGKPIADPLKAKVACITSATDSSLTYCDYAYSLCDGNTGYLISAKFESTGQIHRYTQVPGDTEWFFNVGKCTAVDSYDAGSRDTGQSCRDKTDCSGAPGASVCVGPPSRTCRLKSNQNNGKDCNTPDDCLIPACNKNKLCE